MGSTIGTKSLAVACARAGLTKGLDAYCSFRLVPLQGALPTQGSVMHDGSLAGNLATALSTYRAMVEWDASAVGAVHNALVQADRCVARGVEG